MALYFFHLHECGTVALDEDGIERPDLAAVQATALESAREVMCAEVKEGRLCLSCYIEVKDEAGAVVHTLPFNDALVVTGLQR